MRNITRYCILTAWAVMLAPVSAQNTWYVTTNGAGDGTSWASAFSNIQHGVDAATNLNDTVLVSNGMYLLANQIVITNAIIMRSVNNNPLDTSVNGGFAPGGATTNNRCLLLSNSAAFVSGFTFSNGALFIDERYTGGAGALIFGGTISNCVFRDNTVFAEVSSSDGGGGGGIYISRGTITASRITGNVVTNIVNYYGYGGGVYSRGNPGPVLFYDCTVDNNNITATQVPSGAVNAYGGGMYISEDTRVEKSIISNNASILQGYAGGVNLFGSASRVPVMDDCTITSNYAGYGGGIRMDGGIVTNCVITRNKQGASRYGAALFMSSSHSGRGAYVENSIISNNWSSYNSIVQMRATITGTNTIRNCAIVNNIMGGTRMFTVYTSNEPENYIINCDISANDGLGMYMIGGTARNCRITANTNRSSHADYQCAGILLASGTKTAQVSCCTIAGNMHTNIGAGIRLEASDPDILAISSCVVYDNGVDGTNDVHDTTAGINADAIRYSCVGKNPDAYFSGAGLIVANPRFVNAAAGDFRLLPASPCINRGENELWMNHAVDKDGAPRIRHKVVDMGAYELLLQGAVYSIR